MSELRVPVARLKARLSEYLARIKAGERIVITDRGVPIAGLTPLHGAEAVEGRLDALARAGLVRLPERRLEAAFFETPRPADPEGRSLETLLAERAEGP